MAGGGSTAGPVREERRRVEKPGLSRRKFLVGGGAAVGLIVAWGLWPRDYRQNIVARDGETVLGSYLKIGRDGQVTAVVPQLEMGQGVYTVLPQILADELGADWRTVAVEPAPVNPAYANKVLAEDWAASLLPPEATPVLANEQGARVADWAARTAAERAAFMITADSSSIPAFAQHFREAGAAARVLLAKAAAARWGVEWEAVEVADGLLRHGDNSARFGELAAEAANARVPEPLPLRAGGQGKLVGTDVTRLDTPSKIDGSARYAGDIRLADMVYASVRQGPIGDTKLASFNREGAAEIVGLIDVIDGGEWLAAVGTNWWAANRALDAMSPIFETRGALPDSAEMDAALESGDGARRFIERGDAGDEAFDALRVTTQRYTAAPALHAPVETRTATAHFRDGKLELWMAAQAPVAAIRAAAGALDIPVGAVTHYQTLSGGSFGRDLDTVIAGQAARIAAHMKRPVQLVWSRAQETINGHVRPASSATLSAATDRTGQDRRAARRRRRAARRSRTGAPHRAGRNAARSDARHGLAARRGSGPGLRRPLRDPRAPRGAPPRRHRRAERQLAQQRAQRQRLLHRNLHQRTGRRREDRAAVVSHGHDDRTAPDGALLDRGGGDGGLGRRRRRERHGACLPHDARGLHSADRRGTARGQGARGAAHLGDRRRRPDRPSRHRAAAGGGRHRLRPCDGARRDKQLRWRIANRAAVAQSGAAPARRRAANPDRVRAERGGARGCRGDRRSGGRARAGQRALLVDRRAAPHPAAVHVSEERVMPIRAHAPIHAPSDHPPVATGKVGVLLVNLGTPDAPTASAVRRYLKEFLSDRRVVEISPLLWQPILRGVILNTRPAKSAHAYGLVWTDEGSPLAVHTRRQAEGLADRLGDAVVVDWAMRYGNPSVASRLAALKDAGCERILVAPLYPQYSGATTASVADAVFDAAGAMRWQPTLRTLPPYHDDPAYIGALKASVEESLGELDFEPQAIMTSFHGMPQRTLELGDPYHCHCRKTARLLSDALRRDLIVAFQSRFGRAKWLEPATDTTLESLPAKGIRKLAVVAPGFASDCLETAEELAIRGREQFMGAGGEAFAYLPCLNAGAPGMAMLETLVRRELAGWIDP